jgi:adenylate kinase
LAGSPRTLYEGERVIPFLKKLYGSKNIKVIVIKLTEKESLWRNSHRKECELMRHSILYTKETIRLKRCPFDGSKLEIRKDDTSEIIKVRLKEYKKQTYPVVSLLKKQGLKIKNINGEQSVADVFRDILKVIK